MNDIQIIFFDAGNTLLYTKESVGKVYYDIARQHGIILPGPKAVHKAFMRAWKTVTSAPSQISSPKGARLWWRNQVKSTYAPFGVFSDHQLDPVFEELYAYFARSEAWSLFTDVLPSLRQLSRANIRLGLLSNWDSRLRAILADFGLLKQFDPVIISFEVGYEKPQREIYELACQTADVNPQQALMVGDSIKDDFNGSRLAGMQSILINRQGQTDTQPSVKSLLDVPQAMGLI